MSYEILDWDVSAPGPNIENPPVSEGVAILWRHRGRPIDFWISPALDDKLALQDQPCFQKAVTSAATAALRATIRAEIAGNGAPHTQPVRISVAICTRDRPQALERLLKSLAKLPTGLANFWEVLVVDNASGDDQTRQVTLRAGVRYFREEKPGLDFARNLAITKAKGDYLAYLDDDVVVDSCWLEGLMEAISRFPEAGAFTGQILPLELATRAQILFERRGGFRRGFETVCYGERLFGNRYYPCCSGIFGVGANMIFRLDILKQLGGFDEALDTGPPLPGGGDLDMFYRVVRGGHKLVYEPSCLVFHQHRKELTTLRRQYWSWGLSVMALATKMFRNDPDCRQKVTGLTVCWLHGQLKAFGKALWPFNRLMAAMRFAELAGSICGLFGAYSRSQKRIDQIRRNCV